MYTGIHIKWICAWWSKSVWVENRPKCRGKNLFSKRFQNDNPKFIWHLHNKLIWCKAPDTRVTVKMATSSLKWKSIIPLGLGLLWVNGTAEAVNGAGEGKKFWHVYDIRFFGLVVFHYDTLQKIKLAINTICFHFTPNICWAGPLFVSCIWSQHKVAENLKTEQQTLKEQQQQFIVSPGVVLVRIW